MPIQHKGHRHRRSAAVSLDWRHVTLPPVEPQMVAPRPASCSPTLTFASTLSDISVGEVDSDIVATVTKPSRKTGKRVTFLEDIQEIPPVDSGDTWMKPEDYSWPIPASDSKTILLGPLEPATALEAPISNFVPGSPVLMHRKKRSSFLQSTRNALSRRPSKKRPNSPPLTPPDLPVPAPKSSMIDLDLALGPVPSLRHKKSGSLDNFSHLPASPSKPKPWHRRSDSAPADILFSFSPRPASPDSRKRKMSSILEHPHTTSIPASSSNLAVGIVKVKLDDASAPSKMEDSNHVGLGIANAIPDEMILGEPGEMVRDSADSATPAVHSLRGHASNASLATTKSKKGWKSILRRLLH